MSKHYRKWLRRQSGISAKKRTPYVKTNSGTESLGGGFTEWKNKRTGWTTTKIF
jgi:hypothetical protein